MKLRICFMITPLIFLFAGFLMSGCQSEKSDIVSNHKQISLKGYKTTRSGLKYKIIKAGKGEKPTLGSKVRTHYVGKHLNGEEFDSSYKRQKPAEFSVKGVIRGWQECLQLMSVGAIYEIIVPPGLAYGPRRVGTIQPNETLYFKVELIEIINK